MREKRGKFHVCVNRMYEWLNKEHFGVKNPRAKTVCLQTSNSMSYIKVIWHVIFIFEYGDDFNLTLR